MHAQLLADSVDLAQWGWLTSTDGIWISPPVRGSNLALPHRPGQVWQPKVVDQNQISPVFVVGDQIPGGGAVADPVAQHLANLAAFRAALSSIVATRTLTRRITYPSGVLETTGAFELASFVPRRIGVSHREVAVGLTLLDGLLFAASASANVTSAGATIANPGDASTLKMTLTMPVAGTLTNSTNGVSVTVDAATTLDVLAFTSTAGIGHVTAHAGDDFWMRLDPGNNVMAWTGTGTVVVAYQAAYL